MACKVTIEGLRERLIGQSLREAQSRARMMAGRQMKMSGASLYGRTRGRIFATLKGTIERWELKRAAWSCPRWWRRWPLIGLP